ncbi:glycerophosphodiester phosphodiesterase [Microlunatus elymi]|uniref:glycerophosphodiester phosphodiesterase n=1 Tax=Microlunatus elymi TaxID=2596828 RepID=UPI00143D8DE8|nr:glycerophosphodiester phosphodiesterase [Microlunatus elymi]
MTTHPQRPEPVEGPAARSSTKINSGTSRLTPDGPFHSIAHRGDPVSHRENTLPGIRAALDAGADLVEIDVKVSRDEEVVLLHDLTLERLWNDPRPITELDQDQLAGIGDHDQQIPTLAETLQLIGRTDSALLIDMDSPHWAGPSLRVVTDAVRAGVITADQAVWCGRPDALRLIRQADDQARIIFSWDESDGGGRLPADDVIKELAPEAFNPHWPMLTDEVFGWIADHGLASCCWTVDDDSLMQELLGRGVNAMITNRIHRLQELRTTDA